jgi:hypothetical protein
MLMTALTIPGGEGADPPAPSPSLHAAASPLLGFRARSAQRPEGRSAQRRGGGAGGGRRLDINRGGGRRTGEGRGGAESGVGTKERGGRWG